MAPFQLPLVTLNANESAFLTPIYQEIRQVYIRIGKRCVACNFNSCINTEGLLSETGSDVGYTAQYVHGSISKKMQDRDVVTPSAG